MEEDVQVNDVDDNEKTQAIGWLRGVLTSTLEVSPLSYQHKKKTSRFLKDMPDWLLVRCADSLNIDYIGGSTRYPDMAQYAECDGVRNLTQQYLESHDAVAVGNCLEDLSETVLKHNQSGDLPINIETAEKQVYAMALAGCTDDGVEFTEQAGHILRNDEANNHPVVDYHMALISNDRSKLDKLDSALSGGRYGTWVAERLTEYKRWLCGDPNIHWEIRILPNVSSIYEFLLKGGKMNES